MDKGITLMKKYVVDFEELDKRRIQLGIKRWQLKICFLNHFVLFLFHYTKYLFAKNFAVMDEKLFDIPLADYTEFLQCKTEFEGMHHVSSTKAEFFSNCFCV